MTTETGQIGLARHVFGDKHVSTRVLELSPSIFEIVKYSSELSLISIPYRDERGHSYYMVLRNIGVTIISLDNSNLDLVAAINDSPSMLDAILPASLEKGISLEVTSIDRKQRALLKCELIATNTQDGRKRINILRTLIDDSCSQGQLEPTNNISLNLTDEEAKEL